MSVLMIVTAAVTAWICVMIGAWCASWRNALSIAFVLGIIGFGIGVSWNQVAQYRVHEQGVAAL